MIEDLCNAAGLTLLLAHMIGCSSGDPGPDCPPYHTLIGGVCVEDYGCGEEFCHGPPVPETCNGIDDDRDGTVDEDPRGGPMARWCQESACGMGSQVCALGAWSECHGPVEALSETGTLRCDGLDNDCDGLVDEGPFAGGDVVFLVDRSGSMAIHLTTVAQELDSFAGGLGPDWRFAVAVFPEGVNPPRWDVWVDLSPYGAVAGTFAAIASGYSGGAEPSYDVLQAAAQGDLGLSWRPGAARFVFLLTDERGQSYQQPQIREYETCSGFIHGETVVSFSNHPQDFDQCGLALLFGNLPDLPTLVEDPCP